MVRQIDRDEALGLAAKGMEIKVLAPNTPEPTSWTDYAPDTLQNLLDGCLFFRDEVTPVRPSGDAPVKKPMTPAWRTGQWRMVVPNGSRGWIPGNFWRCIRQDGARRRLPRNLRWHHPRSVPT